MSEGFQDKVTAFDTLFTNNHIQKLKILMSYFDRSMQKNLAIYIKYLELMYTIDFFRKNPYASPVSASAESEPDYGKLFREVTPYCTPAEKKQMESMQNMLNTFDRYKEMVEMMQMMQEMFPEGENPISAMFGGNDIANGMDLSQISQMAQIFNMFQPQGGDTEYGESK